MWHFFLGCLHLVSTPDYQMKATIACRSSREPKRLSAIPVDVGQILVHVLARFWFNRNGRGHVQDNFVGCGLLSLVPGHRDAHRIVLHQILCVDGGHGVWWTVFHLATTCSSWVGAENLLLAFYKNVFNDFMIWCIEGGCSVWWTVFHLATTSSSWVGVKNLLVAFYMCALFPCVCVCVCVCVCGWVCVGVCRCVCAVCVCGVCIFCIVMLEPLSTLCVRFSVYFLNFYCW